jgi:hypothetical protein
MVSTSLMLMVRTSLILMAPTVRGIVARSVEDYLEMLEGILFKASL